MSLLPWKKIDYTRIALNFNTINNDNNQEFFGIVIVFFGNLYFNFNYGPNWIFRKWIKRTHTNEFFFHQNKKFQWILFGIIVSFTFVWIEHIAWSSSSFFSGKNTLNYSKIFFFKPKVGKHSSFDYFNHFQYLSPNEWKKYIMIIIIIIKSCKTWMEKKGKTKLSNDFFHHYPIKHKHTHTHSWTKHETKKISLSLSRYINYKWWWWWLKCKDRK